VIKIQNYISTLSLFSLAGIITWPHRRCTTDKTFEKLLLLKKN